jgi:sterol desaturase/sphingolipid hydroxylase (fatty acid hydroxylase superfamily)
MEQTISQLPPLFLFAAYAVFWGWEAFYAARPRPGQRARRVRNLALSAICIVIAAASGTAVLWLSAVAAREHWGLVQWLEVPIAPACVAGVILLDLTDYLRHRLSHAVPLLWRLHRVHHSDLAVDVTTSLRNHPIEILLRPLFLAATIIAFGIAPLAVLLQPLLQLPILVFQHANVRLPPALDRVLAWAIVTPGMHLVHHSRMRPEADSNYSTFLTLWDRLFGSFRPAKAPDAIGIDGFDQPRNQTLLGLLATPFQ